VNLKQLQITVSKNLVRLSKSPNSYGVHTEFSGEVNKRIILQKDGNQF